MYRVKSCFLEKLSEKTSEIVPVEVVLITRRVRVGENFIDIPHPLSSYINDNFNSLNTKKQYGKVVCSFLNFILKRLDEQNDKFDDLKKNGLGGLSFYHGAEFLVYSIEVLENSRNTVLMKEKILIHLFQYLISNKILNQNLEIEYVNRVDARGKIFRKYINPFQNAGIKIFYPSKIYSKVAKRKDMDEDLWRLFLDLAKIHTPDIVLGIYFQMMGGLRQGEVVNLTLDAIHFNDDSFTLDVTDRQDELFKDRDIDLSSCQVKVPRKNQIVLDPYGGLMPLYEFHLKQLTKIKASNKKANQKALFLSNKGVVITGEMYKERFLVVKKIFLDTLKETSYVLYKDYSDTRWGSHIGRGIFTNYLIRSGLINTPDGKPSTRILAKLRGDRSEASAQSYIDEYTLNKVISHKVNNLKNELEIKLGGNED